MSEEKPMTVGELKERYKLVSVDPTAMINTRSHEGEADSLEAASKMADIILNNRKNISMVEVINYTSGHVVERHIIPRTKDQIG